MYRTPLVESCGSSGRKDLACGLRQAHANTNANELSANASQVIGTGAPCYWVGRSTYPIAAPVVAHPQTSITLLSRTNHSLVSIHLTVCFSGICRGHRRREVSGGIYRLTEVRWQGAARDQRCEHRVFLYHFVQDNCTSPLAVIIRLHLNLRLLLHPLRLGNPLQ